MSHRRELTVRAEAVHIRDVIEGAGNRELEWRFHLPPSVEGHVSPRGFVLSLPGTGSINCESSGGELSFETSASEYSPAYGIRQTSRVCIARGQFTLPVTVEWKFSSQP